MDGRTYERGIYTVHRRRVDCGLDVVLFVL